MFLGPILFRNIGVVMPDLFDRFLTNRDLEGAAALADARLAGVHFVRIAAFGSFTAGSDLFQSSPDRWFAAFDRMLASAQRSQIFLVPSLIYDPALLTGAVQASPADLLQPGTTANRLALQRIAAVVTRYRNDPRVLFWEIGNALNREADLSPGQTTERVSAFLQEAAHLIHRLDRRHPVSSGCGDVRADAWHRWQTAKTGKFDPAAFAGVDTFDEYAAVLSELNPPAIDLISVQQAPPLTDHRAWLMEDDVTALRMPWIQFAAVRLGRPLFVSAFGQPTQAQGQELEPAWTLDLLRRLQADGAPPAALRSWEPQTAGDDVVSPGLTPRLTVALKAANVVISDAVANGVTLAQGPPLPYSDQAVQADRFQVQSGLLHDLAADLVTRHRVPPSGKVDRVSQESAPGTAAVQTPLRTTAVTEAGSAPRFNRAGVTLLLSNRASSAFRPAEAVWLLGSDFVRPQEIMEWVRVLIENQVGAKGLSLPDGRTIPAGSVPDHIAVDGTVAWFPEGDSRPLPPVDCAFALSALVEEHWRLTGRPTLFASSLKTAAGNVSVSLACERAFEAVQADTETGLIFIGTKTRAPGVIGMEGDRADWGFADRVHKSGFCLMPSLMRWRAARGLAGLFKAAGNPSRTDHYQAEADRLRGSLAATFALPQGQVEGKSRALLLSATVEGRKEDLWAEAYAVWLGVLPSDLQQSVERQLLAHWRSGDGFLKGMVRSLPGQGPYGGTWERCDDPPGTGQNGGYWGLPVGWVAMALKSVDADAANALLAQYWDALQHGREQGSPWQWIAPNLTHAAGDAPAVAQPAIALRSLFTMP